MVEAEQLKWNLEPSEPNKQSPQPQPIEKKEVLIEAVPRLRYIKNYITANEHDALLAKVNNGP